jgi:hypothetical protein
MPIDVAEEERKTTKRSSVSGANGVRAAPAKRRRPRPPGCGRTARPHAPEWRSAISSARSGAKNRSVNANGKRTWRPRMSCSCRADKNVHIVTH